MTAFLLLKALVKFLEESVADYAAAQADQGEFRTPKVFDWSLPFKNPKEPDKIDFPFITARITDGEDRVYQPHEPLFSTIHIDLTFGVYHESVEEDGFVHPDGVYDLLNLMEHIRISLFRKSILEKKFRVELPYKWNIPEEQPYPLWIGESQTLWTVQSATQQMIEGVDIHGHI